MTVTVVQVAGPPPLLTTCVAPFRCVMILILTDRLLHSENALVFVEEIFTVSDHELSARLQQGVDLVMYIVDSGFCRFCHMD